jgi:hypothetical protein
MEDGDLGGRILFHQHLCYYEVRAGSPLAPTAFGHDSAGETTYQDLLLTASNTYLNQNMVFGPHSPTGDVFADDKQDISRFVNERQMRWVVQGGVLSESQSRSFLVKCATKSYAQGAPPEEIKYFPVSFRANAGLEAGTLASVEISNPGPAATHGIRVAGQTLVLQPLIVANQRTVLSLLPVEIAVDANRNRVVGDAGDSTVSQQPFRFWVNNDNDAQEDHPDLGQGDCNDSIITKSRDLEDFTLLRITLPESVQEMIKSGNCQVGFRFKDVKQGSPAINIFRAYKDKVVIAHDGYVWEQPLADALASGWHNPLLGTVRTNDLWLPPAAFMPPAFAGGYFHPYLLFEGRDTGIGKLILMLRIHGQELEGDGTWIDLCDIKKMYLRNNGNEFVEPPSERESKEVITFVHGWNMSPEGSADFAETMFKRLWHKGYKGRFAAFRWNTNWSSAFDNVPNVGEAVGAYLADYNGSELTAWNSGTALKQFLESHPPTHRRMLIAHSMGNIVCGEALAQGLSVSKYVLLQSAVPASCYDDRLNLREIATYDHPVALLPNPTIWDQLTPDDDYDPMAYRGKFSGIGGEPISFYQETDKATSFAWEINNDLTKPPGILMGSYRYFSQRSPGQRCLRLLQTEYTYDETILTGYEALARACRSWSKAAGAKGITRGSIADGIDNSKFGFGDVHSAEFNFRSQRCDQFYNELKKQLSLESL